MADSERLALADRLDTEHQHRSPWGTLGCTCPVCPDLRAAARALREAWRPRGAAFENTERDRLAWRDRAWKAESELDAALAEVERLREGIREHKHDALCNGPLFAKERIEALWALLDTPEVTS